jgi:hypothetical protein
MLLPFPSARRPGEAVWQYLSILSCHLSEEKEWQHGKILHLPARGGRAVIRRADLVVRVTGSPGMKKGSTVPCSPFLSALFDGLQS